MSRSLVVDNKGTKLAYTDSGPPSEAIYTTILAVHGVEFTSPIFQKVAALAHTKGVRFAAINRREYNGSTPFSDEDKAVMSGGTDAEKTDFMKDRGLEIANFIDAFIQQESIPPISEDGKRGGVALLGWSSGTTLTAATIAHVDDFPSSIQDRLASHLRVHIMQEPPTIAFGLPFPPQTYTPQMNTFLPEKARIPAVTQWLTSYFQHGDLSTRDTNVLEYILPATFRKPSIWNMSPKEIADIIDESPNATVDAPFALNFIPQASAVYKTATFDKTVKARLPHLKVWEITGDATASFFISALWSIQEDDEAHGGNNVNYRTVPGGNHFMHWDDPEKTINAYLEALS